MSATIRTPKHDYIHTYRGYHTHGAVCRVEVYERDDEPPVFILTELPENANTSITNMAEYLAAELIGAHYPERLERGERVIWIERYRDTDWSQVTFMSYRPKQARLGGVTRLRLGSPLWTHITPEAVGALIGKDVSP